MQIVEDELMFLVLSTEKQVSVVSQELHGLYACLELLLLFAGCCDAA